MNDTIRVTTFNCKNVKSSVQEINEMCKSSDVILLQETWLADYDLSFLSSISSDFYAKGISSVNSSVGVLRGRPHGGLAILWRKSLECQSRILTFDDERLLGLELSVPGETNSKIVFTNVYLPYITRIISK